MDLNKSLEILEALASGYSPITGELLSNENIINERDVIRALQIAIDELKRHNGTVIRSVEIAENEIQHVIQLLRGLEISATPNRLIGFFLATRKFKSKLITSDNLYGKYSKIYTKGQLLDYLTGILPGNETERIVPPWDDIHFFQKEIFNLLSGKDIDELKETILSLGVQKNENLSESILNARINYPRAYEAWSSKEKELLKEVMKKTNDLRFLSECFQRGEGSIESYGKRLIYESGNSN
ncbi:hypothetical protein D3C71_538150 [compost metagenome]